MTSQPAYKPNTIVHQPREADSVETLSITAGYVRAGHPFLEVGPAFMAAHESLKINVKFDRASNHGWVTPAEARQIKKHMTASLTPVAE